MSKPTALASCQINTSDTLTVKRVAPDTCWPLSESSGHYLLIRRSGQGPCARPSRSAAHGARPGGSRLGRTCPVCVAVTAAVRLCTLSKSALGRSSMFRPDRRAAIAGIATDREP